MEKISNEIGIKKNEELKIEKKKIKIAFLDWYKSILDSVHWIPVVKINKSIDIANHLYYWKISQCTHVYCVIGKSGSGKSDYIKRQVSDANIVPVHLYGESKLFMPSEVLVEWLQHEKVTIVVKMYPNTTSLTPPFRHAINRFFFHLLYMRSIVDEKNNITYNLPKNSQFSVYIEIPDVVQGHLVSQSDSDEGTIPIICFYMQLYQCINT